MKRRDWATEIEEEYSIFSFSMQKADMINRFIERRVLAPERRKIRLEREQLVSDLLRIWEEMKHYQKTKTPRCVTCKQNMVQESKYVWKTSCDHNKNVRLSIG